MKKTAKQNVGLKAALKGVKQNTRPKADIGRGLSAVLSKVNPWKIIRQLKRELRAKEKELNRVYAIIAYLRKERFGHNGRDKPVDEEEDIKIPKRKGAPFGHKGVTRAKPEIIDEEIAVPDPVCCPECKCNDLTFIEQEEHTQEEIILPRKKTTKYIRNVFKCDDCGNFIRIYANDEMPKAYIGPQAKAVANYLRYNVGISQHKLQRILKELFGLTFHQTSIVGFETQLRTRGTTLYTQIRKILNKTMLLYIDETGWKNDGIAYWLWCFCNSLMAYYHIDKSRGSKVIQAILGDKYNGIILSDFLSAYNKIDSRKQKCIPHLIRITDRLKPSCQDDKQAKEFCLELKAIAKHIAYLFKYREKIPDYLDHRADIIAQCKKLLSQKLAHKKAERLRKRLQEKHQEELFTCLFHPDADSNNNFVERMIRPNVIMRKLTFGNRSDKGTQNHAVIASLLQTAKLNKRDPTEIFRRILTKPKEVKLTDLIEAPS